MSVGLLLRVSGSLFKTTDQKKHVQPKENTLQQFQVAIEHGPLGVDVAIEMVIFCSSILVYQRVCYIFGSLSQVHHEHIDPHRMR